MQNPAEYHGKIADAHTHIFPAKIAEKATASISKFYNVPMQFIGLSSHLLESDSRIGVGKYLVCSTATRPDQVRSINDFIAGECAREPRFLGFATLHPRMEGWEAELDRVLELGLHGVKLHPDFQDFCIDDPACIPLYRRIAQSGLPVLFHMGDARYDRSAPFRLRNAADAVPDLRCIAAHFGGYQRWQEAMDCLYEGNIQFDTCSSLFQLSPEYAVEMIRHMGPERFFFGTDFPMWDHVLELERFLNLGLTDRENEMILYRNFETFFGVEV